MRPKIPTNSSTWTMRSTTHRATAVTTIRASVQTQRRVLGDTAHPRPRVEHARHLRTVAAEDLLPEGDRLHAKVRERAGLHAHVERPLRVDAEVDLRRDGRPGRDRDGELPLPQEEIVADAPYARPQFVADDRREQPLPEHRLLEVEVEVL